MSRRRVIFITLLVILLAAGIVRSSFFRDGNGAENGSGDSGVIHGIVDALVPSGKVISVKKDDGGSVLLSLSHASTITDELGEDLSYSDVRVGMPISAAGIKGVEDNVLIPSLVTVRLLYAYRGIMVGKFASLQNVYFALRYNEAKWETTPEFGMLTNKAMRGCELRTQAVPEIKAEWARQAAERRLGGNVFQDTRYAKGEETVLRVMTLSDPGQKYGAPGKLKLAPHDFVVSYGNGLPSSQQAECNRAVDEVLGTFILRNASENILLIQPKIPLRGTVDAELLVSGMIRSYDGTINFTIMNDAGDKLVSDYLTVAPPQSGRFSPFKISIPLEMANMGRVKLRLYQYSPTTGEAVDVLDLPLIVE